MMNQVSLMFLVVINFRRSLLQISEEDLLEGVKIVGSVAIYERVKEGAAVLSF
ncbi:hypothetical protein [Maribellus sp. YY47]|uniref:hypothetical protein n=1 Tax=Maribellus sp. YY47 TaxID=2929486 RepID=UPI002000DB26|nr:hypothetical protein [Maribellus sp. YY47]MCK3685800.1 hypothetical protein [Maribellus sp. YY47]